MLIVVVEFSDTETGRHVLDGPTDEDCTRMTSSQKTWAVGVLSILHLESPLAMGATRDIYWAPLSILSAKDAGELWGPLPSIEATIE